MTRLIWLLVLTSNFAFAQRNVALLHPDQPAQEGLIYETAEVLNAPFELINGMAVVRASVNGDEGYFMIDTGSPGIVLNAKTDPLQANQQGTGIGGTVSLGEIAIKNFTWGPISRNDLKGYTVDLSHLESICGRNLKGLIGFEVLNQYEILFDYPNHRIRLYPSEHASLYRSEVSCTVLPFSFSGHIPVVKVRIGKQRLTFGIDSGAEANLLDRSHFDQIPGDFLNNLEMETVTGLDNHPVVVLAADVTNTQVKHRMLAEMRYLFTDLTKLNSQTGWSLDGLLGYPFFASHQVAINFREQHMYIWSYPNAN